MVEAMYEQSPELFKKFQKSFKFCISNTLPELFFSTTNKDVSYAYSKHSRDDTCSYINEFIFDCQFHYHILIEIENFSAEDRKSLTSKLFNVPCLFTCFKELISNVEDHVAVGPIMDKFTAAVLYNNNHSLEKPCGVPRRGDWHKFVSNGTSNGLNRLKLTYCLLLLSTV